MPDAWQARIQRAETIAARDDAAAGLLTFYAKLLRVQQRVYERLRTHGRGAISGDLECDLQTLRPERRPALQAIARVAPDPLVAEARRLLDAHDTEIDEALLAFWRAPSDRQFYPKALLQPYAQYLADSGVAPRGRDLPRAGNRCPFCGGMPQLSVLHQVDDSTSGGGRRLLCATCFTEWPIRRVLCVHCGEEQESKLGYFRTPDFDHLRVDACDACRHYLKSVDLTRLGIAVPIVDEIAGAALDVWARERGYTKIELNLLGL